MYCLLASLYSLIASSLLPCRAPQSKTSLVCQTIALLPKGGNKLFIALTIIPNIVLVVAPCSSAISSRGNEKPPSCTHPGKILGDSAQPVERRVRTQYSSKDAKVGLLEFTACIVVIDPAGTGVRIGNIQCFQGGVCGAWLTGESRDSILHPLLVHIRYES